MSNSFFKFKQFIIHQDKCAMKVCTDACLFGAWVAEKVSALESPASACLDIGTGTGLLSLMLAQKNLNAIIDAVEIDEAAALQAKENFEASPWNSRLKTYHTPLQQFNNTPRQPSKYDVIISNPPFFENDLKSPDDKRNLALHSEELSLEDLLSAVEKHLKDDGHFAVLLPYHRTKRFINLSIQQFFYLQEDVNVKQTPRHNYFRSMLFFSRREGDYSQKEIIIQNEQNQYTAVFVELLKDYYLYL